jgi:hypothetical protein
LIHRCDDRSTVTKGRSSSTFRATALLSDPSPDIRRYLEDLATIANRSTQQAEGTRSEARKVNRKARRRLAVIASFGALGLMVGIAGLAASRSANVRLSEIRDQVRVLQKLEQETALLQQQRKVLEAALANEQSAQEALLRQIADLQQQMASLQNKAARGSRDVNIELAKPSQSVEAPQLAQGASVVDQPKGRQTPQRKILNPPQQATFLQDQITRRDVTDALQQERKAEQATPGRQKPHGQQMTALPPQPLSAPSLIPASTSARPITALLPEASPYQQLLIARQWLTTGRLDEARHVLAMVQTRMVLQPVDPDRPNRYGVNALATEVGNAIRWLDMGADRQAMQALNQAVLTAGAN